jgi:hypothetical protein
MPIVLRTVLDGSIQLRDRVHRGFSGPYLAQIARHFELTAVGLSHSRFVAKRFAYFVVGVDKTRERKAHRRRPFCTSPPVA